jgi:hypothetical protein
MARNGDASRERAWGGSFTCGLLASPTAGGVAARLFSASRQALDVARCNYLPREVFFLGFGLEGAFFDDSGDDLGNFFAGMADPFRSAE